MTEIEYIVLRHPTLGSFPSEEEAVSAAWEVTPPGQHRPEVSVAQKGVQQVRLGDDTQDRHRDPLTLESTDFFVEAETEPQLAHTPAKLYKDPSSIITHCGAVFSQPRRATLLDKRCQACADVRTSVHVCGARVVDWSKRHPSAHIVERAHLHQDTTYVQFHCGGILSSQTLKRVTVIPAGERMCETCFDLDPRLSIGCPPIPSGW